MSNNAITKATIEKYIDSFEGKTALLKVQELAALIPADGVYDPSIVCDRVGQYIVGIQECGKLLASLGLAQAYQETEVDKEEARAALERAPLKGFKTSTDKKLYAQMDEAYIEAKNRLHIIQAVVMHVENFKSSLDKAQLHGKKILDGCNMDRRFGGDHERFPYVEEKKEVQWVDEENLK